MSYIRNIEKFKGFCSNFSMQVRPGMEKEQIPAGYLLAETAGTWDLLSRATVGLSAIIIGCRSADSKANALIALDSFHTS